MYEILRLLTEDNKNIRPKCIFRDVLSKLALLQTRSELFLQLVMSPSLLSLNGLHSVDKRPTTVNSSGE